MSLSDVKRLADTYPGSSLGTLAAQVVAAPQDKVSDTGADALLELLRIEWSGTLEDGASCCISCFQWPEHDNECSLLDVKRKAGIV